MDAYQKWLTKLPEERQADIAARLAQPGTPPKFYVLKCSDGIHSVGRTPERFELTDALCAQIARFNGYMTSGEVHYALLHGQSIYTNFSRYVLE